jgi:hypothetical protein
MTLTLEVDPNEAEILIAGLAETTKHGNKDVAQILDRLRYEIEEQVG